MSWYWNEISDKDSAKYATTTAVWVSYLFVAGNVLIALLSFAYRKPITGIGCLLDAGLFAAIGWRIHGLHRSWAVFGLSAYLLGALISVGVRGFSGLAGDILAIVFLVTFVNAVRGTFAYHKYVKLEAGETTESMQSD